MESASRDADVVTQRWHGAVALTTGVAALASATVLYNHRGYHTPRDAGVVPTAADPARPVGSHQRLTNRTVPVERTRSRGARPARVVIASLDINAPVIGVGAHDGAVDVPADPTVLGWWAQGARPGASTGSVVIAGHVDVKSVGKGALYHLESVPIGARATVETTKGTVTYQVVGRRVYAKQALPRSVFDTRGAPRLVLITCGGPFDKTTRHYADNIVVYGVPVGT